MNTLYDSESFAIVHLLTPLPDAPTQNEVEATLETHRRALGWAARLQATVAYDAQYLALAEQTGAEFWTADKRLADRAHQAKISWVKWIQEQG